MLHTNFHKILSTILRYLLGLYLCEEGGGIQYSHHTYLVGIFQVLLLLLSSAPSVINVVVVGLFVPIHLWAVPEWEQQTGNNRIHNLRMVEVFAFPLCFTEEPSFCGLVSSEEHTRRPCTGIKFPELYIA